MAVLKPHSDFSLCIVFYVHIINNYYPAAAVEADEPIRCKIILISSLFFLLLLFLKDLNLSSVSSYHLLPSMQLFFRVNDRTVQNILIKSDRLD